MIISNSLVSIIIPVYNVEEYLKQCLDSIITQTYSNIEIIIIDDCSEDNTYDIAIEYATKDKRISVLKNEKNLGQSFGRNIGIKKATGEYICFIDGDDWVNNIYVEELVNSLQEEVGLAIPILINYDNKNDYYGDGYHDNSKFNPYEEYKVLDKSEIYSATDCFNSHAAKIWKTKDIKDNNILFPENLIFEDNIFTYNYLVYNKEAKVAFNHRAIYYYRQNIISTTTTNSKFINIFIINKMIKNIFIKHNLWEKYQNSLNYNFCASMFYWGLITRTCRMNRDIKYFQEMSNFIKEEIERDYLENILKVTNFVLYKKVKKISSSYKKAYYYYLVRDVFLINKKSIFKPLKILFTIIYISIFQAPVKLIRLYK